jgi:iron complex transport system substrate-binding protein
MKARGTSWVIACCAMLCAWAAHAASSARIVSLKPSITDTIVALGAADQLVGVTRYCELPASAQRPEVVADYTRPYAERVIAVHPDLILDSQENGSRRAIENLTRAGLRVELFPFGTLSETLASIRAIGRAIGQAQRGEQLAAKMERALSDLTARSSKATPLRAVVIWGLRPLIAAGPGTYMDELLATVGARNAIQGTRIRYPHIGLEELIALDPDAIVDLSMDVKEGAAPEPRPWDRLTTLRAVRDGRVIALDPGLFRAGPGLPAGLSKLAELLHKK